MSVSLPRGVADIRSPLSDDARHDLLTSEDVHAKDPTNHCISNRLRFPLWPGDHPGLQKKKDTALVWVEEGVEDITLIKQTGKVKRYHEEMLTHGVHFRTGKEVTLSAAVEPGNYHSGGLLGVHGKDSHVRFTGKWRGDEGGCYPMLVLREGGKMTWAADSHIDFVMHPNFFTRQIWVWGDGTGTLELEEGFVADNTKGATVADAMGTIRLVGTTLITHHSQSLPYNNRPDGRGGIYHNGHIVFEGDLPSVWKIRTNPHRYASQLDFRADTTVDCEQALTHTGQIRVCLPVGNGGHFISTGAFRTIEPNVTITKTGPAMISLDGQQAYYPGAKMVVKEGLVRFHTDPAASDRLGGEYGNHLNLVVENGGKVVISTPLVRLQSHRCRRRHGVGAGGLQGRSDWRQKHRRRCHLGGGE